MQRPMNSPILYGFCGAAPEIADKYCLISTRIVPVSAPRNSIGRIDRQADRFEADSNQLIQSE